MYTLPFLLALALKLFDGNREEAANPFMSEIVVQRKLVDNFDLFKFNFGSLEIQGKVDRRTSTFETVPRLFFVCNEMIYARSEKRSKTCPDGIVRSKKLLFHRGSKKALSEILGVFIGLMPFYPDILVSRFPVTSDNCFIGQCPPFGIITGSFGDNRPMCNRKALIRPTDTGVLVGN